MLNPDSPEGRLRAMGVSPALSAAYDVLEAADLANHERLMLCYYAEKGGKDPEDVARMLVRKCRLFQAAQEQVASTSPAAPTRPVFTVGGDGETQAPPTP